MWIADQTTIEGYQTDLNNQLPWWVLPGLCALMMLIFAGTLIASFFLSDQTLKVAMCTAVVTLTTNATSFYFGSSRGSERKDEIIANGNRNGEH